MPERTNWKRLALEMVVIISSILMAFGIEAWWSGQQEQEELDALVELLRADIAANIADFERLNRFENDLDAIAKLSDIVHSVSGQPAPDSLAMLFRSLARTAHFAPVAVFPRVNGPGWALVPQEVKFALAEFSNPSGVELETSLVEQVFLKLNEVFSRYGGVEAVFGRLPEGSRFAPDYDGLLADAEFATWLMWFLTLRTNSHYMRDDWIERLAALDSVLAGLQ